MHLLLVLLLLLHLHLLLLHLLLLLLVLLLLLLLLLDLLLHLLLLVHLLLELLLLLHLLVLVLLYLGLLRHLRPWLRRVEEVREAASTRVGGLCSMGRRWGVELRKALVRPRKALLCLEAPQQVHGGCSWIGPRSDLPLAPFTRLVPLRDPLVPAFPPFASARPGRPTRLWARCPPVVPPPVVASSPAVIPVVTVIPPTVILIIPMKEGLWVAALCQQL